MATSTRPTTCSISDCDKSIPINPKAKRPALYCSVACRQKAYRRRHAPPKHNAKFVTLWDQAMNAIDNMDMAQRQKLQMELEKVAEPLKSQAVKMAPEAKALTVDELQEQGGYLVYYSSPRSSVMHFSHQNQSYTFCRRNTKKMRVSYALPREAKVCQQCQGRYKEIRS